MLFADTSALVKLYVEEEGSAEVAALAAAAATVAVCRITWVEMLSAFARREREQPESAAGLARVRERFAADWPRLLVIELTQALAEQAGEYAEAFALRAYDSVQLAALELLDRSSDGGAQFACFDTRLVRAARVLGIAHLAGA